MEIKSGLVRKTKRTFGRSFLLASFVLNLFSANAVIIEYEFVDLTYNGETLIPQGISNDGAIVGVYGYHNAFVLHKGVLTRVDIPYGDFDTIRAINPSGTVCVGSYWDPFAQREHSFEYRLNGGIRYLPDLGDEWSSTVATDITDSGMIVGSYYTYQTHVDDPNTPFQVGEAFVMQGDDVRTFSAPGAGYTYFGGVNNAGQVVGYWREGGPRAESHLFRLEDDTLSPLPLTSLLPTLDITDINNRGQIIGWGGVQGIGVAGFLLDGEDLAYFQYPQKVPDWTRFTGINDHGVIVGYRYEPGPRGFIAYPKHAIPEVSSLALLLAGAPLVAFRRRRSNVSCSLP